MIAVFAVSIDDKYIYLALGLALLAVWLVMYAARSDLRRKMNRASVVGIFAGPLAEVWYLNDYWNPPLLGQWGPISLEDYLVGFAIAGIAVAIYDVVFRQQNDWGEKDRKPLFAVMFVLGLVALSVGSFIYEINSMLISSVVFLVFTAVMIALRRDLFWPSILSGLLCVAVVMAIYAVLFGLVAPHFWHDYGQIGDSPMDIYVPGNIPLLEVAWYFAWGALAGIGYEFALGMRKEPKASLEALSTGDC